MRRVVSLVICGELGLVNGGIIVSTDTASMILRKYKQSVLQSLCSIGQHFLDFFSSYAICVHWKCAKQKKKKIQCECLCKLT